jgi:heavy metal translocating P-type ATPase
MLSQLFIPGISIFGIICSLITYLLWDSEIARIPLLLVIIVGGLPLVYELLKNLFKLEFGADLIAGIAILTSFFLGEYLAGAIVVLMLSGGNALEGYALKKASSALSALAKRLPTIAHKKESNEIKDISAAEVNPGDLVVVFPFESCPVDGEVVDGHGTMDESFLTGEPFMISKTPGCIVISGAINQDRALTIKASKRAVDSRYAQIMGVVKQAEEQRPPLRRLADRLGAIYTPATLIVAIVAGLIAKDWDRFLSVLVVATPCPLLLAVPIAIIGAISVSAKRGIIVRDAAVLEELNYCKTIIFDKTGTLTYAEPSLTEELVAPGFDAAELLALVASLERYSKHPLAKAILTHAKNLPLKDATNIHEPPGEGLKGNIGDIEVTVTSRKLLAKSQPSLSLPASAPGLECVILINGKYAATYRFHDTPRSDSKTFINHLADQHGINQAVIISGDRESEVRYLADLVGIKEIYASCSPEEKVTIVKTLTANGKTAYIGDGINDAPALLAATVGIAMGQMNEATVKASGAVILESSLTKVDEFLHISRRMRKIALESAWGGMIASMIGMSFAACGYLSPVFGAILQEIIDVIAILYALRASFPPEPISDRL